MERIACVDIPNFALQRLAITEPAWAEGPLGIVAEMRPQSPLLQVNQRAREQGVQVGMRYGAALSLCPYLRVECSTADALEAQRLVITERLQHYSPLVERHRAWPDSFWLRGKGMATLWKSATMWAQSIHTAFACHALQATVVTGFSRFLCLAIARQNPGKTLAFRTLAEERAQASTVALECLGLAPELLDEFARLGVRTLAQLQALPTGAVQRRYGVEAASLLRLVREEAPLETRMLRPPKRYETEEAWDEAVPESTALLFLLQAPLERIFETLSYDGLLCASLHFCFHFDWPNYIDDRLQRRASEASVPVKGTLEFELRAAHASLDVARWNQLLRLRLEHLRLPLGVKLVHIRAQPARAVWSQESWGTGLEARTPRALLEELATLRTELGENAVGRLEVRAAHLPEARQGWLPLDTLEAPAAHPRFVPTMVRRMRPTPAPFPLSVRGEAPKKWLPLSGEEGRRVRMAGPYVVSGAWWHREVEREYYYVHVKRGDVLWVYYDRVRARWFLHAQVY